MTENDSKHFIRFQQHLDSTIMRLLLIRKVNKYEHSFLNWSKISKTCINPFCWKTTKFLPGLWSARRSHSWGWVLPYAVLVGLWSARCSHQCVSYLLLFLEDLRSARCSRPCGVSATLRCFWLACDGSDPLIPLRWAVSVLFLVGLKMISRFNLTPRCTFKSLPQIFFI